MKVLTPIYIIGSRHHVTYYGDGIIHIGCVRGSFDTWLHEYKRIGRNYNYTEEQIEEYKKIIDIIIMLYGDQQ